MHLHVVLLCLGLLHHAAGSEWCYSGCEHSPQHWADIDGAFCGHERQSPIDIVTSHVETDPSLGSFTFQNFSSPNVLRAIVNNGHTAKVLLVENEVEVSGGGLDSTYSTLQFHFHWGDTEHHPGSEHTVDGHRYPMEMHIVSLKKGLNVTEAVEDPEGIAVLGFFITATEDGAESGPWEQLVSYLSQSDKEHNITHDISIHDLIGDVNLTKYYRYNGSLTTPLCNEAVVWTVFQEPIRVHKDLIKDFPKKTGITNVYRPTQSLNGRTVLASPAVTIDSHAWCYGDHCHFNPSHWHLLPNSYCSGHSQSPVNIETQNTMIDERLDAFTFSHFDDKHAFKYIINTGHTVKVVLKEDLVEVSGGGLGHVYSTLQFHLHWGSESHDSKGSEHTVDSKRYPMELHIVNKRKDLKLEDAVMTPNGLAVLGFFIEAPAARSGGSDDHGTEDLPATTPDTDKYWTKLNAYLSAIHQTGSQANFTDELSLDDLLGDVDRTLYFRYNGSLTTPTCNEAVVWTVFEESIQLKNDLMVMFPNSTGYHDVFRPSQTLHGRQIYRSSAPSMPATAPTFLFLLLACFCAFFM